MPKKRATAPAGIGARLTRFRKAAGLTQEQLAHEIGISQRMVAYYECTEDFPLAKMLRHLARILNVSTDELLGIAPPTPTPPAETDPVATTPSQD